jgi:hypothetical protein
MARRNETLQGGDESPWYPPALAWSDRAVGGIMLPRIRLLGRVVNITAVDRPLSIARGGDGLMVVLGEGMWGSSAPPPNTPLNFPRH